MLSNRLLCELALLSSFKEKNNYLTNFKIVDDDVLKVEFSLIVKDHLYEFIAVFNRYYPYQPIQIIALTDFYSSHQYKNGAMCLKWGQDNWNSDVKFVDLLENLYDLLYAENPLGEEHAKAESGDSFTFGQTIKRMGKCCIVIPFSLDKFDSMEGTIDCVLQEGAYDSFTFVITKINDHNIFGSEIGKHKLKYFICENEMLDEDIPDKPSAEKMDKILFFNTGKALLFFANSKNEKPISLKYIANDYEIKKRIDIHDKVLEKKIVVIGLGSIGSRVTVDLARAGFKKFLLVDDDIMMPFNVIRHELTYTNVGEYKVNALKTLIEKEINEDAVVETSTLAMTGQESTTSTNKFIEDCSDASLIIDCTADDSLLLMLSKMTKDNNIPLISGTVIPGGLGNIVLIKKSKDVDIESILSSYYKWVENKTIFAKKVNDYSSSINDQTYTATMSDCSILSGFIGKFAIQLLEGCESQLTNINIFSTSDYCSLEQFYKTYKIDANQLPLVEESYNPELIESGKAIYEDFCSKRNNKKDI